MSDPKRHVRAFVFDAHGVVRELVDVPTNSDTRDPGLPLVVVRRDYLERAVAMARRHVETLRVEDKTVCVGCDREVGPIEDDGPIDHRDDCPIVWLANRG